MRILLLNPPIYDFTCYDYWLKPLGLLYIASFLKKNKIEFEFFDFMDRNSPFLEKKHKNRFFSTGKFRKEKAEKNEILEWFKRPYFRYGLSKKSFYDFISKKNFDYVFITSMMTYWYEGIEEVVKTIREVNRSTKIILGGVYAKLLPEHAKTLDVDFVFTNDVDKIYDFLINNTSIDVKKSYSMYDLIPAYDFYKKLDSAAILTQLGCPYRCKYCAVSILNDKFSTLPFENVLEQLDLLAKMEINDVTFYDDSLLFRKEKHFLPLFKKIVDKRYTFRFNFSNGLHVRYIDDSVIDIFKRLNIGMISLSVESISSRLLEETGNKNTLQETKKAIDLLLKNGFDGRNIFCYILLGLPYEDKEDVMKTMEFLRKKRVRIVLNEFSPVPKTVYFQKYKDIIKDPLFTNKTLFTSLYRYSQNQIQEIKNVVKLFNRETNEYYENG